jgi:homoserine O-succinyltransferase
MPLMMDGDRIPTRWAERQSLRPAGLPERFDTRVEPVKIAFINNMPDAALEDTELQFFELLDTAAGEIPVSIKLYSLSKIPRSDRAHQHLGNFYVGISDLLNTRFDAIIMTGTEPHHCDLRKEPYWDDLANILDWAEQNTASTVLSCLAAHAAVLHGDGIGRHLLPDKRFGVFDEVKVCAHILTSGTSEPMRFPHSRWNEVRGDVLASCGYALLTSSTEAGVNLFVKKRRNSLFVHFQGHPEYGAATLAKEYRRDIKRFLRQERQTYPTMPHGYFNKAATKSLAEFRERALSQRREELMAEFPEAVLSIGLERVWHSAATRLYRNWLQYVASRKVGTSAFVAVTRAGRGDFYGSPIRKRAAASQ